MRIKIRKANKKDILDIIEYTKKVADYHHNFDKYYAKGKGTEKFIRGYFFKNLKKRNYIILVAEINGRIVGFFEAEIKKIDNPFIVADKIGELHDAFVDKKYRKSGIGKKIYNELVKWFKKNKIKHILLSVHVKNMLGKKVWGKLGFKDYMKRMRLDL